MANYNGTINNLIQGVSQQPRIQRIDGQLESQSNCLSSIIKGFTRRPSTKLLKFIDQNFSSTSTFYTYDRGDNKEKYLLVISSGIIYIYDLETGQQKTVTNSTYAQSYLTVTDPNNIQLYTVGDTTFLLNTDKTIESYNSSPAKSNYKYIIHCKKASYGGVYTVHEGVTQVASVELASTVTLGASEVSKSLTLKSGLDVCFPLYLNLYDRYVSNNSIQVFYWEGIIYVASTTDLQLTVNDSNGNAELFCMDQEVNSYSDLPNVCPRGYKVKVTGDDDSDWNDYYVEFISSQNVGNIGRGFWKECIGWNEPSKLNYITMPYKLVRNSNETFSIAYNTWVEKEAGDEDSNPLPSFVGDKITSMLFYQDRFVFSTSSTVCASMTSDYFNFFSDTVTSNSASDPIDTSASDNKVTDIQHMLTFNGALVIFSRQGQYFHSSDIAFDSDHFALVPKSHFSSSIAAKPQTSATQVYLPFNSGDYTGIKVLDTNNLTGNIQGRSITDYVNKYIHGTCKQILVSPDHNFLFVLTQEEPKKIYVYQWYEQNNELKQQAWHVWDLEHIKEIKYISIIGNLLYIVCFTELEYYGEQRSMILTVDLYNDFIDNIKHEMHFDICSLIYGTLVTPYYRFAPHPAYAEQTTEKPIVVLCDSFEQEGRILVENTDYVWSGTWILVDTTRVTLKSGMTPYIYVGYVFNSEAELTNPYIIDYKNNIINKGILRYKQFIFTLEDTGFISVILNKNDIDYSYDFNANIFDLTNLDSFNVADYMFRIPVRERTDNLSIKLISNTHRPFRVLNLDWSGTYREKGRRI